MATLEVTDRNVKTNSVFYDNEIEEVLKNSQLNNDDEQQQDLQTENNTENIEDNISDKKDNNENDVEDDNNDKDNINECDKSLELIKPDETPSPSVVRPYFAALKSNLMKKKDSYVDWAFKREEMDKVANPASENPSEKKNEQREKKIPDAIIKWTQDYIPNWGDGRRIHRRTKAAIWKGVPSSVRGQVWNLCIQNDLQITKELYDIFRIHARTKAEKMEADEMREKLTNKKATPNFDTTEGDLSSDTSLSMETNAVNLVGKESSVGLIILDISRTFPQLCFFKDEGPYNKTLRSILETYVCYRPDIGYVQGMSFIAAMCLLNMDEVDAFKCFANLVGRKLMMSFFKVNMKAIDPYFHTFDHLFNEHLSSLFAHFQSLGVSSNLYLFDWWLTIFSKSLPLEVSMRVWDNYLVYGDNFLFRTALGILSMYSKQLIQQEFDEIAYFLTHLPTDFDCDCLFDTMEKIDIQEKRLDQLLTRYTTK